MVINHSWFVFQRMRWLADVLLPTPDQPPVYKVSNLYIVISVLLQGKYLINFFDWIYEVLLAESIELFIFRVFIAWFQEKARDLIFIMLSVKYLIAPFRRVSTGLLLLGNASRWKQKPSQCLLTTKNPELTKPSQIYTGGELCKLNLDQVFCYNWVRTCRTTYIYLMHVR